MDTIVIGAGGHGKVVVDILRAAGLHRPVGFIDADPNLAGATVAGLPVLGQINALPKLKSQKIKAGIVAIGDSAARLRYAEMLLEHGLELINAVHPSAVVSATAQVGRNVVIAAGAIIGVDAVIADSAIINTGAVVDHECEIGAGVHIGPAAALAGRVRVGSQAFVGLGSRVIQCLSIGMSAVVGAGAVVIRDVPDGATVVGVPARVIRIAGPLGDAAPNTL